jgi:hypothetical protein
MKRWHCMALAVWAWGAPRALAQTQTITFDDAPAGTAPGATRYARQGVTFPAAARIVSLPTLASSKPNVVMSNELAAEFDPGPLRIAFAMGVTMVAFRTGVPWNTSGAPVRIVARAYDASGAQIAEAAVQVAGPGPITTPVSLQAPAGRTIHQVSVDAGGHFEYLDDLRFAPVGTVPSPPAQRPTVVITSPPQGSTSADGRVRIEGTIVGPGMHPEIVPPRMSVAYGAPAPEPTTYQTYLFPPQLSPAGAGLAFDVTFQLSHLGPNAISVEASNAAGAGKATVSVVFWPLEISQEHARNGAGAYGNFEWGERFGECLVALFQRGAIFSSPAGTYSAFGSIFEKWKSLSTPVARLGTLGCATANATQLAEGSQQDFRNGRVYAGAAGTFYTVEPFLTAIDRLDFTRGFGWPVADPARRHAPGLPRLWQRFERTAGAVAIVSTMEITDGPPTLWVATPDASGAQRVGAPLSTRTPTVWQSFSCQTLDGPCDMVPAKSATPMPGVLPRTQCTPNAPVTGPQWVAIHPGLIREFEGSVKSSGLAGEDFPFNHACNVGASWTGVDWCLHLVPAVGSEGLLFETQPTLEVEWEWCLAGYPPPKDAGDPSKGTASNFQVGDRVFVAGRHIYDCGHGAKTEIHPPAVLVHLYTESGATVGRMVTFGWWYPQQEAALDVFPPPRPTPDATLTVSIPYWSRTITPGMDPDAGIANATLPQSGPNHLNLRFRGGADARVPPQEPDGQLLFGCLASFSGRPLLGCPAPQLGTIRVGWTSPRT